MSRLLRVLVAAFGDAGHAFPALALGRALRERGHEVTIETWERWRDAAEGEGLDFEAAEEYRTFPPPPPGSGGPSVSDAAKAMVPMLRERRPDVVVADILTQAPALAAEVAGLRRATLVPHVYPVTEPQMPFFAVGARPARTPIGRALWRAAAPLLARGLARGREELNRSRTEVGLPPLERFHGGLSEELVLVGTFPQLEYPRRWPPEARVVGPMQFELPGGEAPMPAGEGPLVVVAPSTAQDPEGRLLRVALGALAGEPVRILAATNRPGEPLPSAPANATVVEWLRYSEAMAAADLVVCHGGHGTVARALAAGKPVLCCPALGDMSENGARVQWSGAGLMLPWRLTTTAALRAVVRRMLGDGSLAARAGEIGSWAAANDGAARGAELVEELARAPASARA